MTNMDGWLEEELRKGFVPFSTAPLPAGAPYRVHRPAAANPWFAARFATRTGIVLVAAACGLMASGALAAAAVTGTADPRVWTVHLTMVIGSCTGQVAGGQSGGIGSCLDAVVHYRGPKVSEPRARDRTDNANSLASPDPEAATHGKPAGVSKSGPAASPGPDPKALHGGPGGVPLGPPTGDPHGRPSDVPVGSPTPHGNPPTTQPTPQGRTPSGRPTPQGKAPTAPPTEHP